MATSKCHYQRPSHRFFSGEQILTTRSEFELDEWDIFNQGPTGPGPAGFSFSDLNSTTGRIGVDRDGFPSDVIVGTAPVNVPDWSKILGEENRRRRVGSYVDDGDDVSCGGGGGRRLPPHEYLARRRIASFSVQEGAGRTLKGRDLSRVRNAIFEITGFQD